MKTYRAMQVAAPGLLELVERVTPEPGAGQVLIEVEACGICGADANNIEGADPTLQPPRVPGHEVVGRIAAIGSGTGTGAPLAQIKSTLLVCFSIAREFEPQERQHPRPFSFLC